MSAENQEGTGSCNPRAERKGEEKMEMRDLISRKALIDWFMPYVHSGIEKIPVETVIEDIKGAPAVEAVTVVHGQWVGTADGYADGELVWDEWACSECGHEENTDDPDMLPRYCPNCGAKMDLED